MLDLELRLKKSYFVNKKKIIVIIITILMIMIAGMRPIGFDGDSSYYVQLLNQSLFNANYIDKEPAFWVLTTVNNLLFFGNQQTFFMLFALIGVTLKIVAIYRSSLNTYLSIFTYICLFYFLHEMTQIRIGVAAGLFLLALPDAYERNLKQYLIKTAVAISFHYSAIVMLLIYLLNPYKLNVRIYFFIPVAGLILLIFSDYILSFITISTEHLPPILGYKLQNYVSLLSKGIHSDIRLINYYSVGLICIYYYSLFKINLLKYELDLLYIKILSFSIFIFFALSSVPVIAFRISEFFATVIIFMIPNCVDTFRQRMVATYFTIIFLSLYAYKVQLLTIFNYNVLTTLKL
jgi:hypothetical protein